MPHECAVYDSRTWHRAGVNRTNVRRAAILQVMIPNYAMPFIDTSASYKEFLGSPVPEQLTDHERTELMLHRIVGPGGQAAITTDRELTELAKSTGKPQASAC